MGMTTDEAKKDTSVVTVVSHAVGRLLTWVETDSEWSGTSVVFTNPKGRFKYEEVVAGQEAVTAPVLARLFLNYKSGIMAERPNDKPDGTSPVLSICNDASKFVQHPHQTINTVGVSFDFPPYGWYFESDKGVPPTDAKDAVKLTANALQNSQEPSLAKEIDHQLLAAGEKMCLAESRYLMRAVLVSELLRKVYPAACHMHVLVDRCEREFVMPSRGQPCHTDPGDAKTSGGSNDKTREVETRGCEMVFHYPVEAENVVHYQVWQQDSTSCFDIRLGVIELDQKQSTLVVREKEQRFEGRAMDPNDMSWSKDLLTVQDMVGTAKDMAKEPILRLAHWSKAIEQALADDKFAVVVVKI